MQFQDCMATLTFLYEKAIEELQLNEAAESADDVSHETIDPAYAGKAADPTKAACRRVKPEAAEADPNTRPAAPVAAEAPNLPMDTPAVPASGAV